MKAKRQYDRKLKFSGKTNVRKNKNRRLMLLMILAGMLYTHTTWAQYYHEQSLQAKHRYYTMYYLDIPAGIQGGDGEYLTNTNVVLQDGTWGISFFANGFERMRLTNNLSVKVPLFIENNDLTVTDGDTYLNGHVGIGTTNISNDQVWARVLDVRGVNNAKMLVTTDNGTGAKTGMYAHDGWNGRTIGAIGTESNHDLVLMAGYENDQVIIKTNGNVGIGTDNPAARLDIGQGSGLFLKAEPDANTSVYMGRGQDNSLEFDWGYGSALNSTANIAFNIDANNIDNETRYIDFKKHAGGFSAGTVLMRIQESGNVGIGTENPADKLEVVGNVRATSFVSSAASFPDYVFAEDYSITPLSELETYVKANSRLPNMPSEKEVVEQGLNVPEVVIKSVENIETIYLHLIRMEKEIKALQQENTVLKQQLEKGR